MFGVTKKSSLFIVSTLVSGSALAGHCVSWPTNDFQPTPDSRNGGLISPVTGIEWLKSTGSNSETAVPACTSSTDTACFAKLKQTGYFDPSKPTVIFIHGWQPDTVTQKSRFDFCYQYDGANKQKSPITDTLHSWKHYNVGVFYWNQFADDQLGNAEAKIYTSKTSTGMRWAYLDDQGKLQYCTASQSNCAMPGTAKQPETVVDMAFNAYKNALPPVSAYAGHIQPEIRIAGQSLGTQIAIQLTDRVLHDQTLPQPTRMSLMDPYFSPDSKPGKAAPGMPQSVADFNTAKVTDILSTDPKFAIDEYRTSKVSYAPLGNPNTTLMDKVAYLQLYPLYIPNDANKQLQLHESSIYLYFESMKSLPSVNNNVPNATNFVNAKSSTSDVSALMGQKRYQLPTKASYNFADTQDEAFSSLTPMTPVIPHTHS